jgi:hypothetical protein
MELITGLFATWTSLRVVLIAVRAEAVVEEVEGVKVAPAMMTVLLGRESVEGASMNAMMALEGGKKFVTNILDIAHAHVCFITDAGMKLRSDMAQAKATGEQKERKLRSEYCLKYLKIHVLIRCCQFCALLRFLN